MGKSTGAGFCFWGDGGWKVMLRQLLTMRGECNRSEVYQLVLMRRWGGETVLLFNVFSGVLWGGVRF